MLCTAFRLLLLSRTIISFYPVQIRDILPLLVIVADGIALLDDRLRLDESECSVSRTLFRSTEVAT